MRNSLFMIIIVMSGLLTLKMQNMAQENAFVICKDNPVSWQGSISFILHIDKPLINGYASEENFSQILVEIPGLATCVLERSYSSIYIAMEWDSIGIHNGYGLLLTELPGPEKYHILFTWNAKRGLSDGYFNGIPFRTENPRYYEPWEVYGVGTRFNVPSGHNHVTDVVILNRYMPKEEAVMQVPKELKGKHSYVLGQRDFVSPIDITGRQGKLLYSSRMNDEASLKGWVLEGPAVM